MAIHFHCHPRSWLAPETIPPFVGIGGAKNAEDQSATQQILQGLSRKLKRARLNRALGSALPSSPPTLR